MSHECITPRKDWTKAAETMDRAGKNLRERYGGVPFDATDIGKEVQCIGGYAPGTLLPSDYCYNLVNRDPRSFRYHIFEWLEHGKYRYLGPNHSYTGPIVWKEKQTSKRRQVGEWKSGQCYLWEDPRKQQQ